MPIYSPYLNVPLLPYTSPFTPRPWPILYDNAIIVLSGLAFSPFSRPKPLSSILPQRQAYQLWGKSLLYWNKAESSPFGGACDRSQWLGKRRSWRVSRDSIERRPNLGYCKAEQPQGSIGPLLKDAGSRWNGIEPLLPRNVPNDICN